MSKEDVESIECLDPIPWHLRTSSMESSSMDFIKIEEEDHFIEYEDLFSESFGDKRSILELSPSEPILQQHNEARQQFIAMDHPNSSKSSSVAALRSELNLNQPITDMMDDGHHDSTFNIEEKKPVSSSFSPKRRSMTWLWETLTPNTRFTQESLLDPSSHETETLASKKSSDSRDVTDFFYTTMGGTSSEENSSPSAILDKSLSTEKLRRFKNRDAKSLMGLNQDHHHYQTDETISERVLKDDWTASNFHRETISPSDPTTKKNLSRIHSSSSEPFIATSPLDSIKASISRTNLERMRATLFPDSTQTILQETDKNQVAMIPKTSVIDFQHASLLNPSLLPNDRLDPNNPTTSFVTTARAMDQSDVIDETVSQMELPDLKVAITSEKRALEEPLVTTVPLEASPEPSISKLPNVRRHSPDHMRKTHHLF
jgi:hypothetical protein